MAELKKCPFCGGEVMLDREDIFCDNCHLSMKIDDRLYNKEAETYEEAKEQAIEAWNNRATEAEIRAKAIDEFAEKLNKKITDFVLEHQNQLTFVSGVSMGWKFVDEIAEQLKEE